MSILCCDCLNPMENWVPDCNRHRINRLEKAIDDCWERSVLLAAGSRIQRFSLLHLNVMNMHLIKEALDEKIGG